MGSTETNFTQEEVDACVEEAHRCGKRVCAQAREAQSIVMCCKAGVDVVYHASYCDAECRALLCEQKDRVFVAPAINFPLLSTTSAASYGLTPEMAKKRGLIDEVDAACAAMKEMHEKGIRVLPGGDYGYAWAPHGTYARDLDHFVRLFGYTPKESLLAGTALGGEIMGYAGELGKVQPGYYADRILVDTADVTVFQDTARIHGIFINGHKHKLDTAPHRAAYASWRGQWASGWSGSTDIAGADGTKLDHEMP
ncbi:hypothetical protein Q5752_006471 [Cryptotrichosporon argae]